MTRAVTLQERHEARFQELLEAVPDATIMASSDGRIVLANTQAEALFGYARHELVGQPVEILVPDAARAAHVRHREAYAAGPATRPMGAGLELAGRHRDGSQIPVEVSLRPVETEDGVLIAAAVRDISERKRVEQTLRDKHAELERATSAKDRFLAGMSHELRTPLNAILGFTGTLLMGLPGPINAEQQDQLEIVRNSARGLLALVNDLLDVVKIESGRVELALEAVDCRAVVTEVACRYAPEAAAKGLTLDVDLPEQPVVTRADRRTLARVLANLTDNAVKFTAQGGVRLTLTGGDGAGPAAVFRVADTGPGIPPDEQESLFDAFAERLAESGGQQQRSGLGLHIARRLTELLGGTIACHSHPGQGSTFTIELGRP